MENPFKWLLCGTLLLASVVSAQPSAVTPPEPAQAKVIPTTMSEALAITELSRVLDMGIPLTIFAPSDTAFREFGEQGIDLLEPDNRNHLRTLLAYHIVAGELTASRILKALCSGEGAAMFTTIQGEPLIATMEGVDIVLMDCYGNTARIVKADTSRDHLVFHEIDHVVLPDVPSP